MAKKQEPGLFGSIVLIGFFGFLLYSCFGEGEDDPPSRQSTAELAEEKRKGFHCLSAWDGSHRDFMNEVKRRMRDPDSFEHISTRVTPRSDAGTHTVLMEYRARNGFGGMNVGTAMGTYKNSTCEHTVITLQ